MTSVRNGLIYTVCALANPARAQFILSEEIRQGIYTGKSCLPYSERGFPQPGALRRHECPELRCRSSRGLARESASPHLRLTVLTHFGDL